jgi:REP-associated tyrosine transposase
MSNYHRRFTPNTLYFFTVVTYQRKPLLTVEPIRSNMRNAFEHVRKRWKFDIEAIVLLPDHLHTIWKLPDGDSDYSTRWRLIKDKCTRSLKNQGYRIEHFSDSRIKKKEHGIWQRRFWEHQIRNEKDFENHMDYIHYNPIKHGYVESLLDWKWSSFHRYVKMGWYDPGWGATMSDCVLPHSAGE